MPNLQQIVDNLEKMYMAWHEAAPDKQKETINYILPFINCAGVLETAFAILDEKEMKEDHAEELAKLRGITVSFAKRYKVLFLEYLRAREGVVKDSERILAALEAGEIDDKTRSDLAQMAYHSEHLFGLMACRLSNVLLRVYHKNSNIEYNVVRNAKCVLIAIEDGDSATIMNYALQMMLSFRLVKTANKYFLDNVDKRTWCVRQADVATNVAYCIDHFAKVEQGGFVEEELFAPLHLSGKAKVKFAPSMQEKELAADVEAKTAVNAARILYNQARMRVGFEMNFRLHAIDPKDELQGVAAEDDAMKRYLTSYYSMRKGQPVTALLRPIALTDLPPKRRLDVIDIQRHLAKNFAADEAGLHQLQQQVLHFTDAEIFFYKLFFLTPEKLPLDVEGVYDATKRDAENLAVMVPLIRDNLLHRKLLGGANLYELTAGVFEADEALPQFARVKHVMHRVANECGFFINNMMVQPNFSFYFRGINLFNPAIVQEEHQKGVYFNELGIRIIAVMADAFAASALKVPGLLNLARSEVLASFDRTKNVAAELEGTMYANPDIPYANGKSTAIRISRISPTEAVAEMRYAGGYDVQSGLLPEAQLFEHPMSEEMTAILVSSVVNKVAQYTARKGEAAMTAIVAHLTLLAADGFLRTGGEMARFAAKGGLELAEETKLFADAAAAVRRGFNVEFYDTIEGLRYRMIEKGDVFFSHDAEEVELSARAKTPDTEMQLRGREVLGGQARGRSYSIS